jgi:hypothetical protein
MPRATHSYASGQRVKRPALRKKKGSPNVPAKILSRRIASAIKAPASSGKGLGSELRKRGTKIRKKVAAEHRIARAGGSSKKVARAINWDQGRSASDVKKGYFARGHGSPAGVATSTKGKLLKKQHKQAMARTGRAKYRTSGSTKRKPSSPALTRYQKTPSGEQQPKKKMYYKKIAGKKTTR